MPNSTYKQICSYCGENYWRCRCENFHPSINVDVSFKLTFDEALVLQKYFIDQGYMSHEFHQQIHDLSAKLDKYLQGQK